MKTPTCRAGKHRLDHASRYVEPNGTVRCRVCHRENERRPAKRYRHLQVVS